MRLIDADALMENAEYDEYYRLIVRAERIRNAPTIDAQPVVHSYWEVAIGYDPNKKVQCQNCFLMAHEPTSRCPHCGAHMDEEMDYGEIG